MLHGTLEEADIMYYVYGFHDKLPHYILYSVIISTEFEQCLSTLIFMYEMVN